MTLGFRFLLIDFGGLESDLQGEDGVAHFLHVRVSGPLHSGGTGLVELIGNCFLRDSRRVGFWWTYVNFSLSGDKLSKAGSSAG